MRAVISGGNGDIYRGFPTYMHGTTNWTLRPYPERLKKITFYAKIDSGTDDIRLTLRDASNRAGLYRSWNVNNVTTDWKEFSVQLDTNPHYSGGTWDASLIDEVAFTDLANGRTFDIDHIDLATTEFQFLQYISFNEKVDNFQYFQGTLKAQFRSHGESVSQLS